MKKILLFIVLTLVSSISHSDETGNSSDYVKWGTLSKGGLKSKVDYPHSFSSLTQGEKINPASYGYPLNLSIRVKSHNVVKHARLWTAFDDGNRKYVEGSIKHGESIIGTNNWKMYTLTTPIVPRNAAYVRFGIFLNGAGVVEVSSYRLK